MKPLFTAKPDFEKSVWVRTLRNGRDMRIDIFDEKPEVPLGALHDLIEIKNS